VDLRAKVIDYLIEMTVSGGLEKRPVKLIVLFDHLVCFPGQVLFQFLTEPFHPLDLRACGILHHKAGGDRLKFLAQEKDFFHLLCRKVHDYGSSVRSDPHQAFSLQHFQDFPDYRPADVKVSQQVSFDQAFSRFEIA
jgi:hypothetical protein